MLNIPCLNLHKILDRRSFYKQFQQHTCDLKKKTCGKRRNCWLPVFSPFPTMFSNGFFLWSVKHGIVWQKVFILYQMKNVYRSSPFTTQSRLLMPPPRDVLLKTWWKKEKMLVTSIFSFSHNIFFPFIKKKKKINFWVTFIFLSANAFTLDKSKILPFGKGLNWKDLQTTN